MGYPLVMTVTKLLKMAPKNSLIYRTQGWWFSTAMLVYQRVHYVHALILDNWVWINTYKNTIFRGMNIHFNPAILM